MLCPEVWDFKAPQHSITINNSQSDTSHVIDSHYFNHSVSMVLPNTTAIPEQIRNCLLQDTDYYRIFSLKLHHLIDKEFIEAFVKKGELTLLTVGKKIDTESIVAICPTKQLILSLVHDDFQRLGLDGKLSCFDRRAETHHVVTIDLNEESFTPGRKFYEHVKRRLQDNDWNFDVILAWNPPDDTICPSSIAGWFDERNYKIKLCRQKFTSRAVYSLNVPLVKDNCDLDKFFEWLGLFSIAGNIDEEEKDKEYLSSYESPEPSMELGQVQLLQWTGFFTREQIKYVYNVMREFVTKKQIVPWASLDVQGFADSPISWNCKEHTFNVDGDNSFTVVFPHDKQLILRKSISSNNKPRIFQ